MTAKELFLNERQKASRLREVTMAPWFQECLTVVRAQLMGMNGITGEQVRGAMLYEAALLDLPVELPETSDDISAGLNHNIDTPRPTVEKPSQPERKTKLKPKK